MGNHMNLNTGSCAVYIMKLILDSNVSSEESASSEESMGMT